VKNPRLDCVPCSGTIEPREDMTSRPEGGLSGRARTGPRAHGAVPARLRAVSPRPHALAPRLRAVAACTILIYGPAANHGLFAIADALFPVLKTPSATNPCAGHGCLCAASNDCLRGCCCAPDAASAAPTAGGGRIRVSFVEALRCAGDPGAGGAIAGGRSLAPHFALTSPCSIRLPAVAHPAPVELRGPRMAPIEPPEDVPRISV
jgi:hypothetical protein